MQSKKSSPRTKRSDNKANSPEAEVASTPAGAAESVKKQKTAPAPVSKIKAAAQSHRAGKTTVKPEEIATTVVASPRTETPVAEMPAVSHEPPKVMAAAAGARSSFAAPVAAAKPEVTHSAISDRAYYFWAERGFQGGSPDEDWARAERELRKT